MDDLIAFVNARLDDLERVARAATPGPWEGDGTSVCLGHGMNDIVEYVYRPADAVHIAAHDPASVLRDVAATRAIVTHLTAAIAEVHQDEDDTDHRKPSYRWVVTDHTHTLRLLALRWSTHPAYRPEWRPE